EREEELVDRAVDPRRGREDGSEIVGTEAPPAEVVAVYRIHGRADPQVRARRSDDRRRHPKNTERRRCFKRVTIACSFRRTFIASRRARNHFASSSPTVSRIGLPNFMYHLVGRGNVPRRPRMGKNGVMGTYGIPKSLPIPSA